MAIIIFVVASISVLLLASGYRINFKTKSLQKTGLIYVKTIPETVNVYFNSKEIATKTPTEITYLRPGRYSIKISSKDRVELNKNIIVEGGKVTYLDNVIMFYTDIKPTQTNEELVFLPDNDIKIIENEIWDKDRLILRMSKKIFSATKENSYYFFSTQESLYAIDSRFNILTKLFDLNSPAKELKINSKQKSIYWSDEDNIFWKAILY